MEGILFYSINYRDHQNQKSQLIIILLDSYCSSQTQHSLQTLPSSNGFSRRHLRCFFRFRLQSPRSCSRRSYPRGIIFFFSSRITLHSNSSLLYNAWHDIAISSSFSFFLFVLRVSKIALSTIYTSFEYFYFWMIIRDQFCLMNLGVVWLLCKFFVSLRDLKLRLCLRMNFEAARHDWKLVHVNFIPKRLILSYFHTKRFQFLLCFIDSRCVFE